MPKMRNTFKNIGRELAQKQQLKHKREQRNEGRKRALKITLLLIVIGISGSFGLYAAKGTLFGDNAPVPCAVPKWTEVKPGSKEYSDAVNLVDKIVDTMERNGVDGLRREWSRYTSPESISNYKETLSLYKGGKLTIESVRKGTKIADCIDVFCKSPTNQHRLKITLRMEYGVFKLSGADMAP